ncbi:hypothetical protein BXO88_01285 [Oribacterium sp. C9]|uniref:hypothetical protein n=1 Tax=Oribacterium sp. C9 TaxID=1943579 RepID=UPI00098F42A3|nr:hypothetical protein [Oribacterium sp. C9]OON88453.1 hypothetical protein BXO88_01285 [Oribacterium sp. C9]
MVKGNFRNENKIIKKIDLAVFLLLITVTAMSFRYKEVSEMIDRFFLSEKRNPGYYEILNNYGKSYISDELYEKGTKNLMVNALWSGMRDAGYSIDVHPDGGFAVSGSYKGDGDRYEYPMSTDRGLILPVGDYILSDGGASSEDGISLRVVGVQYMRGGETNYVSVACLPERASFHWYGDVNTELLIDMVVRPGFKTEGLEVRPMLLKTDDTSSGSTKNEIIYDGGMKSKSQKKIEFQPCLTPNYEWENEGYIVHSRYYLYSISKGAIDGEVVTDADWSVLTNSIRYQMQADHAIIDLLDGTGIEIEKKEFPNAVYGKLDSSKRVREGIEIKITDLREVMDMIQEQHQVKLDQIRDFYDYLKALDGKDYTVFIVVKDEGVNALNHGSMKLLKKLGVKTRLIESDKENNLRKQNLYHSYYAILKCGKVLEEKIGAEKLTAFGKLQNGVGYTIESEGAVTGEEKASIKIDGVEYAMNLRGMNFVVYDEEKHEVVDSVCFDTNAGLWCHRQP